MAQAERSGRTYRLERTQNDVVYLRFEPGSEVDLAEMEDLAEALSDISAGTKLPLVVMMGDIKSVERDARHLGAQKDVASAVAIVARSAVARAIGNFYTFVSKPETPTKLFATEEEALAWVRAQQP